MDTTIPIRNLYHLLCYAWDRLDERELIDAGKTAPPRDTLNLLGRVLGSGVAALVRRGFERGYRDREEEIAGIRGRLEVAATFRRELPKYGLAACRFDELEHDTAANRIIRATLTLLVRSPLVEVELRHELVGWRRHFRDVADMRVTERDCRRVVIHRNNRHYGFLLELCALVLAVLLPDENGAGGQFRDFSRDHQSMARMFEEFVRNFYRHHAAECGLASVERKTIAWAGEPHDAASERGWPGMKSDICVRRRSGKPLVIDCKFYRDPLKRWHERETLSAANLYQVFTYAENLARQPGWEEVEGLLLYAQTGKPFAFGQTACGRRLRAVSVNLDADWAVIHRELVEAIRGG